MPRSSAGAGAGDETSVPTRACVRPNSDQARRAATARTTRALRLPRGANLPLPLHPGRRVLASAPRLGPGFFASLGTWAPGARAILLLARVSSLQYSFPGACVVSPDPSSSNSPAPSRAVYSTHVTGHQTRAAGHLVWCAALRLGSPSRRYATAPARP